MTKIPQKNDDIVWRNLDGEAVLLNPQSGKYYGLNAVGCSFWEKIDGSRTVSDIAGLLLEEYDVDPATLEKDLEELVTHLLEKEIITMQENN